MEKSGDGFGLEPIFLGEDVASECDEWGAPVGVFEGEVERLFRALGDARWEVACSELTPDGFVVFAGEFCGVGKGEGEVDDAVVEEGGAVLKGVGHGVFVLTNKGPVGEPVSVLSGEKLIQCEWRIGGGRMNDWVFLLRREQVGVEETLDFVRFEKSVESSGLSEKGTRRELAEVVCSFATAFGAEGGGEIGEAIEK